MLSFGILRHLLPAELALYDSEALCVVFCPQFM